MDGWIKLHRKIINWGWYHDPNTRLLFIHLLLTANHQPQNWQGILIQPGQLVTGRLKLAHDVKLSEQSVRTSLNKLKLTGEITIKVYPKYSIITLLNWDRYQETNQQPNQQLTSNQPATNQQLTTNKNDKNVRKKEEEKGAAGAAIPPARKYSFTDDHLKLAKELWDYIHENYPYYKQPDLEKWAHDVRLINEVDGFSIDQIEDVAVWALTKSDFWKQNIRSADKLRKHFPKLLDQSGLYQVWRSKNVV